MECVSCFLETRLDNDCFSDRQPEKLGAEQFQMFLSGLRNCNHIFITADVVTKTLRKTDLTC